MPRTVSIVTANLFTHDGKTVVLGGLERYTRDLAFLCRDLGFDVTIHQFGDRYWEQWYEGLLVKAYPWASNSEHCVEVVMKDSLQRSDFVIYGWIGFQTKYQPNSIAINHGIWFDVPGLDGSWGTQVSQSHVLPAIQQVAALVTVDLNFVNWARTVIPSADINKVIYIPNYVDTKRFFPTPSAPNNDVLEILYPRRYDRYRGIYLMQEIVPELLAEYPNIRFNFAIDENHPHLVTEWEAWLSSQPHRHRIAYRHYGMDEMPEAYRNADIVVVPSICSEGTSFSVLEAMACGKAIVVTNVGGLSNLVLPNYNGKIVNPTKLEIKRAIAEYIQNREEREQHGMNAHHVAVTSFDKARWDRDWVKLIQTVFSS